MKRRKPKRITFLNLGKDRLGNQMFQIAATIGFAKKLGIDYIFRRWPYNQFLKNPVPTSLFVNLRCWRVYREQHYRKNKVLPASASLSLYGGFQSEKYFKHCESDIRNHFTLKNTWTEYIENKYQQLKGNTCSIHVRRGDKLMLTNKYPTQPLSYYEKAANELYGANLNHIQFVICSDDIEWCKNNFKFPNMIFVEGEVDIIDLFIMSMCGDNIIANSTFSWWSAWLNQNQNRVVGPKNWYGPKKKSNNKGLCNDNWIRL